MKRRMGALALSFGVLAFGSGSSWAFCGFYVAKADAKLFNQASRVVLVRDGNCTVLTMANDFKGDPTEFAMVVPVPTFLERDQIHVTDPALLDHLDAYSAPRLVEYHDPNPCRPRIAMERSSANRLPAALSSTDRDRSLGVTVEARYTVGEYDIVILSAEESTGLETWLHESGYRIPSGASEVLGSYIKQNMRFFVARVDLQEQSALGFTYLRPLQIAFESPKFMLPIRLGMINSNGPQELFVFALTRKGRVETTNYRTVRLPTGMDLPLFVEDEFAAFYRDMFGHQVEKHGMHAVFLEYAWDMAWCDPCAADPLSTKELRELGVFWLDRGERVRAPSPRPVDVFVTRLHVRYDEGHFPGDLLFQETGDRGNFQGRYVLRHPWTGLLDCPQGVEYEDALFERRTREATTLASLTGWDLGEIRAKMDLPTRHVERQSWWRRLWDDE